MVKLSMVCYHQLICEKFGSALAEVQRTSSNNVVIRYPGNVLKSHMPLNHPLKLWKLQKERSSTLNAKGLSELTFSGLGFWILERSTTIWVKSQPSLFKKHFSKFQLWRCLRGWRLSMKLSLILGKFLSPTTLLIFPFQKSAGAASLYLFYKFKPKKSTGSQFKDFLIPCLNFCFIYLTSRFTVNRMTGIGEDNYEVEAQLSAHIPEILPIGGRRLHVSYIGQLKQCRNCFDIGHIAATCESSKVDWLEYVATLHKSGKFKSDLFDGWMPLLRQYHSDYKEQVSGAPTPVQRGVIDLSNIARNNPVANPSQNPWQNSYPSNSNWHNQSGGPQVQGSNPYPRNQGYNNNGYPQQSNFQRPRGRGRGFYRGNSRGRYQKIGTQGLTNYQSSFG